VRDVSALAAIPDVVSSGGMERLARASRRSKGDLSAGSAYVPMASTAYARFLRNLDGL
jgi:hypothetical protein